MKKQMKLILAMALSLCCIVTSLPVSAAPAAYTPSFKGSAEDALAVSSNAKEIYYFLIYNMGLNSAAACGILANIRRESSFNPDCLGDGGTSYGICQWHDMSPGNGRYTNLIDWCTLCGFDYTTVDGQLHYLQYELAQNNPDVLYNGQTIYNYMLTIPNTAQGAYDAGYYWCNTFEVPFANNPEKRAAECDTRGLLARDTYWAAYCEPSSDDAFLIAEGIQINWEASAGAYQYELYRYANSDPSTMELITVTTDTYAVDTDVKSGTAYTYMLCVVMLRADGTSYTASAKEIPQYYLGTPTITKCTGSTTGQKIKWTSVAGATSYTVFRSDDGGDYAQIATTDGTSYKDATALSSGVRYSYQVCARHEEKGRAPVDGLTSNAVGTYTLDAPSISGITVIKDGVKLKWSKVANAKYYTIYCNIDGDGYTDIATVTKTSFTDTEAPYNSALKYKITAHYVGGAGQTSKSGSSKAISAYRMNTPKMTSLSSTAGGSVTPKWERDKKASGYEIAYTTDKSFKTGVKTLRIVSNSTTSWKISGLKKGTTYYVHIRSYLTGEDGSKCYSAWCKAKKCKTK